MWNQTKKKAFSLIEIIVATGIFSIIAMGMIGASANTGFSVENSEDRLASRYLVQEAQEALHSIKEYDFEQISGVTEAVDYQVSINVDHWELALDAETIGKFTRAIQFEKLADFRYEAVITVSWNTDQNIAVSNVSTMRLTNWKSIFWVIQTEEEFNNGFLNSVKVIATGDGGVDIENVSDWSDSTASTEDIGGTGDFEEFVVVDNLLYGVTTNNTTDEEFVVYDISDVSQGNFTEIDSVELNAGGFDLVLYEGYAYIASAYIDNELQIINLSTLSISTVNLPGNATALGIDAQDDQLVVTRVEQVTSGEVDFYDITSPGTVVHAASREIDNDSFDVGIHDGYAYVVNAGGDEIEVFDLSDYSNINSVDLTANQDGRSIWVDADNDEIIVGRNSGGIPELVSIDISSPEFFTDGDITNSAEIDESVLDIYVHDGFIYTANEDSINELARVDQSDYSFQYLGLANGGGGESVWFQGAHVIGGSSHDSSELQVLSSASDPWSAASVIDEHDMGDNADAYDVFVEGGYAYVVRGSDTSTCTLVSGGDGCEFLIYNISDIAGAGLVLYSVLNLNADANDIYVNDGFAYIASSHDDSELMVVDVSSPLSPSVVGGFDVNARIDAKAVWGSADGDFIYLGRQRSGGTCEYGHAAGRRCELLVFDVGDTGTPASPVYRGGEENNNEEVYDITVKEDFAYIGRRNTSSEIIAFDMSDPGDPAPVVGGTYNAGDQAYGLFYDSTNDVLHAALRGGGYDIIDLSSGPTGMTLRSSLSLGGNNTMVTAAPGLGLAFVVGQDPGEEITIVDISNLDSISAITTLDLGGDASGVATDGTYAYATTKNDDLEFQVIGGGSVSANPAKWGIYTSEIFDSENASVIWKTIEWNSSGTGIVELQTRTAGTLGGMDTAVWVGSDGTNSTHYTLSGDEVEIDGASGTQFIQVRAFLTGNGVTTPILEDISIKY